MADGGGAAQSSRLTRAGALRPATAGWQTCTSLDVQVAEGTFDQVGSYPVQVDNPAPADCTRRHARHTASLGSSASLAAGSMEIQA